MKCEECHVLLSAQRDGELTAEEEKLLERHLGECSPCRDARVAVCTLGEGLRSLPKRRAPQAVREALRGRLDRLRQPAALRWLAYAAAAALVALVGGWATRPPAEAMASRLHLHPGGELRTANLDEPAVLPLLERTGERPHQLYRSGRLAGRYRDGGGTGFVVYLDSGPESSDGFTTRVSYDFEGDGRTDRVETFAPFATDAEPGWERYTQLAGLRASSGAYRDFRGGTVQMELWNPEPHPARLLTGASPDDLGGSHLALPFTELSPAPPAVSKVRRWGQPGLSP